MSFQISLPQLEKAKPENLIRLARSLQIPTEHRAHLHLARIVHNRIRFPLFRFSTKTMREEYEKMWQNF